MPWKLRVIPTGTKHTEMKPGGIMFVPYYKEKWAGTPDQIGKPEGRFLSDRYLREDYDKRDPLIICLPDGWHWCIDQKASNGLEGWQITGEMPNLTASPSILSPGYHGFLRDGILTDDLEGRTYGNT